MRNFFDGETTYQLYRRALIAKKAAKVTAPISTIIDNVVGAFKRTVLKAKTGNVQNFFRLFL